ncbi:MAG: polysaccharide deacetylase family protein, partial [Porphyrobacter sp.]|nr:polysaccharide deacetylase family protein [Porphyrobacter sp.]
MFHGIGTPLGEMEDGEENYWIDWEMFDSVVEYCAKLPAQADRFTFDDGNLSDVEAARRMRRHGIGGYFFVLVGRIGKPGYLDADNIQELMSLGMEIGLHGRDHRDWRKVDDATLASEIDLAAEELEAICGRRIDTLSIPFGAYDKRVWSYLERSKLNRIYTSDRGVSPEGSRFVRRNSVTKWQSLSDLR